MSAKKQAIQSQVEEMLAHPNIKASTLMGQWKARKKSTPAKNDNECNKLISIYAKD